MLSPSTTGPELAKLFKVALTLERDDVAHLALSFFKPQRLTEMTNGQLVEVLSALILVDVGQEEDTPSAESTTQTDAFIPNESLKPESMREKAQKQQETFYKVIKTLEYSLLRRVHSFTSAETSKIIQAYCHLIKQGKVRGGLGAE